MLLAIVFLAGLRWWVPEEGTRGALRGWGLLLTFVSVLVSMGISLWFPFFHFYMD